MSSDNTGAKIISTMSFNSNRTAQYLSSKSILSPIKNGNILMRAQFSATFPQTVSVFRKVSDMICG